ncbi:WD40 repeat-like protein [Phlegmacium glaucopus]|nr:WD40 repeat-like protein [Phlegmacium glaucopus]
MHIVSASDDHTARIWNTATGECEAELTGHSNWVNSAVFSPDGMNIVSASSDHTVCIWNTATGECEAELQGYTSVLSSSDNTDFIWKNPHGVDLSSQPPFLAISENAIFHTKNLQRIWIPPPFHKPHIISQHLSKICLGYASGDVLVLEFLE